MSPPPNSLSNTPKADTRHVIRFETDSQCMQQTTIKTKDLRLKIEKKKRKRVLINRHLAKLSDLRLEIEALKNKRSKQLKANLPDLRETINKNRELAAGKPNPNIHRQEAKPKPIQPSENPLPATSVNTNGFSRPKFQLRRNFKATPSPVNNSDDAFYFYRTSNYKSQPKIKAPIEKQRQQVKIARTENKFDGLNANRSGISILIRGSNEQQVISPESIPLPLDEEFDADDLMLSHLMASFSFSDGPLIN